MTSIVLALLLNQLGTCKQGFPCEASNYRATQRPLGSCLPLSDGGFNSQRGKIVYDYSDAGHYYQCDGLQWQLMEGSTSTPTTGTALTLTPGPLKVGGAGMSTDGGLWLSLASGATPIGITNVAGTITVAGPLKTTSKLSTSVASGQTSYVSPTNTYTCFNAGEGACIIAPLNGADFKSTGGVEVGTTLLVTSSKSKGTITLSAGTGTATVLAGVTCVCSNTSVSAVSPQCAVALTTLTATIPGGASTDVIAYHCF